MQGPANPQPAGPPGSVKYDAVPTTNPVLTWIQMQTSSSSNKHVLMSTQGPYLAAVKPGDEVLWCNPQVKQWALLAQSQGAGASPGGGQGVNVPGFGTIPIPGGFGFPGTTIPANTSDGGGGGGGNSDAPAPGTPIQTPIGPVTIPGVPGFNMPANGGQQNGEQQQPGNTGAPAPGTVIQTPLGPVTIPGVPAGGGGNGGGGGTGEWPADHTFYIRPGDIASAIAHWYTGNFARAEELRALNNLTKVGSGANTQYVPWQIGQKLKLPLDWNTSKGMPPPNGPPPSTAYYSAAPTSFAGLSLVGDIERLARDRAQGYAAQARAARGFY